MQSSRSKLTTCLRKGYLLRFESNRTSTSDGCALEKLENFVWPDSVLMATKVCSQIGCKRNEMFEHVETSIDTKNFDLLFEDFLSNLPW